MKIKALAAIIFIAILAISPMLIMTTAPRAEAGGVNVNYITFSDTYMSNTTAWAKRWGSGTVTITDIAGPGVQFDFVGADKVGVADDYLVEIPGVGEDLSAYSGYELYMKNIGVNETNAHLFMNTGHTGGGSWRDTFWGGPWINLLPGETKLFILDFSYAEAWNIADDLEYTGRINGQWYPVFRLNEVTKIGIEVGWFNSTIHDDSVVAMGSANPELYVDPPSVNKDPSDYGTTFPVDIIIEDFTDFYAFDIEMTWDSSLLTFDSASYTSQLNALWGTNPDKWSIIIESSTAGSYKLAATKLGTGGISSTGAYALFTLTLRIIKTCNFPWDTPIHFESIKLSDSATPLPNPIVPGIVTDGGYTMSATAPDLELKYVGPSRLEYCKMFEIEVYATHICANLEDYDLEFSYNTELLEFFDVDRWGVLGDNVTGNANYEKPTLGTIHVWDTDTVPPVTGDSIFLFALTFHVKFDDRIEHIWRQVIGQPAYDHMHAQISLTDATLSFLEGEKTIGEITMPSPVDLSIYFIRGDVNCDGKVLIADISTVGYYYEKTEPAKYDLAIDGIINLYDIVVIATNYGYGA